MPVSTTSSCTSTTSSVPVNAVTSVLTQATTFVTTVRPICSPVASTSFNPPPAIASTSRIFDNFSCDTDCVLSPEGNEICDQAYDYYEGWGTQLSPKTEEKIVNGIKKVEENVLVNHENMNSEILEEGTGRDVGEAFSRYLRQWHQSATYNAGKPV